MVVSKDLGAGRRRGLMAIAVTIMEWTRVVDTISLRGRGGRVGGRIGRIGDGGSRDLSVGRESRRAKQFVRRVEDHE